MSENIMGEEFLKARCLMNSEVSLILQHKYEHDPIKNQMSEVFEKSLEYAKRFVRYKSSDSVRKVREILSRYGLQLSEVEICVLGNLCPETVDEAIAMAPSISPLDYDAIEEMLYDLSLVKKFE